MRKTGEIVFVCHAMKEDRLFLYLYTLQQDGSVNRENKIKCPCKHHQHYVSLLLVHILWRDYLAISCKECRDIKLVDLETNKITTAYSDEQPMGKMCRGWHKIYVEIESDFLELDCSNTKFTKMRQTETGKGGFMNPSDLCYVPPPHNSIVPFHRDFIQATFLDGPKESMWLLSDKDVDGERIISYSVVYSSRHDALLVTDDKNKTIWVLNPCSGEILQNIDLPLTPMEPKLFTGTVIGFMGVKVFIRGSQLVNLNFRGFDRKIEINYFSLN